MSNVVSLDEFLPVETIVHEVKQPGTGKPTGWRIVLAGADHPKALAWSEAQQRKRLARAAQIEAAQLNGKRVGAEDRTTDDIRRENVAWICSRIVGWEGAVKLSAVADEPLPYSEANAERVIGHARMGWLVGQLIEVLNDDRSFTPRSASGSQTTPGE